MQINWFTVIAQIINFLVLVWLLKRFLYKPVLKAIDEREQQITLRLREAEEKKADAQKERAQFNQKNKDFDDERTSKMNDVAKEAAAERERLLEQAKNDYNTVHTKWQTTLKDEQQNYQQEVNRKTQEEVFDIAHKTLSSLASKSLEDEAVKVFITRLQNLSGNEKEQMDNAFNTQNPEVIFKSAFPLSDTQKKEIETQVSGMVASPAVYQYQINRELISGIEIILGNYKLSWNLASFLQAMKNNTLNGSPASASALTGKE